MALEKSWHRGLNSVRLEKGVWGASLYLLLCRRPGIITVCWPRPSADDEDFPGRDLGLSLSWARPTVGPREMAAGLQVTDSFTAGSVVCVCPWDAAVWVWLCISIHAFESVVCTRVEWPFSDCCCMYQGCVCGAVCVSVWVGGWRPGLPSGTAGVSSWLLIPRHPASRPIRGRVSAP